MPATDSSTDHDDALTARYRRARGRAGMASRWGSPDADERLAEMRHLQAEVWIRRTLATAPPLTAEQRDRLAALLRPTGGDE